MSVLTVADRGAAGTAAELPGHQPGDAVVWQYPSEQMFFNAMKRKGWDAKEEDMPAIVAIHNGVNERAWHQVCQYEVWTASLPPSSAACCATAHEGP